MRAHELLERPGKTKLAVGELDDVGKTTGAARVAVDVRVARHGRGMAFGASRAAVRALKMLGRAGLAVFALWESRHVGKSARVAFDDGGALVVRGVACGRFGAVSAAGKFLVLPCDAEVAL